MAKKTAPKRLTRAQRNEIISIANSKGLTAEQVEKRFGVSKWTYYGWRKRSASTRRAAAATTARNTARTTRATGGTTAGMSPRALREELRTMLPAMVREEVTRTLADLVGRTMRTRGRR
ncbi:MAG: hypothetical protein ACKVU1_18540 [bacterium]